MLEGLKSALGSFYNKSEKRIKFIAFLTAIILSAAALMGCTIKSFVINDGTNTYTVSAPFANVDFALSRANLRSKNYKVLKVSGSDVKIAYLFPVHIVMGDKTLTVNTTTNSSVEEILKSAGYTPDEHDMVEPALDTNVTDTIYIDYTDVNYITGTYKETIPSKTETVYSPKYNEGVQKLTEGSDGLREVSYTSKVVNGKTVETTINRKVVLTKAVNAKKIIGTKLSAVITSASVKYISTLLPKKPIDLDKNGNPVNYKKKMKVEATAYTYTGNNCATGVAPQPGYIAVNPKIIPYGTKMYIKSCDGRYIYGYAIAADTGGFIKTRPTNVDLFFPTKSDCRAFGRRNVEIYFLK